MCRHELLLLVESVQKTKCVRAKADDRHDPKQHKRSAGPSGNARPLTPGSRGEHHKRQHKPSGGLHAYSDYKQSGRRP